MSATSSLAIPMPETAEDSKQSGHPTATPYSGTLASVIVGANASSSCEGTATQGSEDGESATEYEEDEEEITNTEWTININELPGKTICAILEMASNNAINTVDFAFRASLVCKLWKELAFAIPKLWSRIDSEGSPEVVRSILARSEQAPLDVRIYLNPTIPEADGVARIEWFATLIAPERHRFHTFIFHYYYPSWFEAASSLLTTTPTLEVDTLDVRRLQFYNPAMRMTDTTVGVDKMTLIPHRLRYDGIHLPSAYSLVPAFSKSLKSLDIRWSDFTLPPNIFLHMLSEAVNLEYLRLTGLGRGTSPHIIPGSGISYPFPSLHEAVYETMTASRLRALTTYMETPALERLLLDLDLDDHPCGAIVRICQRNPQLQHLRLNSNVHMKSNICTLIFSSLSSLTHLHLSQTGSEDDSKALDCLIADPTCPESVLCPNLSSVVFDCAENVRREFVVALVKSRVGITGVSPIKSLKQRWIGLEAAEKLWEELKEIVEVTGLELILECMDESYLSMCPEPVEEWLSEDGELGLDSGDEELFVPGGVDQGCIIYSTRRR